MAWLSGWGKRVKLTVSNANIDAALGNFPILVYLSASSGPGSDDVSCVFDELTLDANRLKIAVTTSDEETQCYVEIEKWDDANEQAWLHVKVPAVASGAVTELYLYYDVEHADNTNYVGDTNSVPAENVWDANFVFVSHMQDDPDTGHIRDSTGNDNDGHKIGANQPIETNGKVGKAQSGDGVNDVITIASHASLNFGSGTDFTLESIVKPDPACIDNAGIICKKEGYFGDGYGLHFTSVSALVYRIVLHAEVGSNQVQFVNDNNIDLSVFSYLAGRFDRNGNANLLIYGGTTESKSASMAAVGDIDTVANLELLSGNGWESKVIQDETRISNTLRPAAWCKATYYTLWDNLLTYGSEEITTLFPRHGFVNFQDPGIV